MVYDLLYLFHFVFRDCQRRKKPEQDTYGKISANKQKSVTFYVLSNICLEMGHKTSIKTRVLEELWIAFRSPWFLILHKMALPKLGNVNSTPAPHSVVLRTRYAWIAHLNKAETNK